MNDALQLLASRILVIDDNQAIHEDFRKIFGASRPRAASSAAELALFGEAADVGGGPDFLVDSAYQGQEGLAMVRQAQQRQQPYAMAFIDVRMPPGWDGIETTAQILHSDPDVQIVICTAYSDYSWGQLLDKLGRSDRLVILKKPFDTIEVLQLASAMTEKWRLARDLKHYLQDLEQVVGERTEQLAATKEQYRTLLESTSAVPWEMASDTGACTYIGRQVESRWGWLAADFAEPGFFHSCVHADDLDAFAAALSQLATAGELDIEYRMRKSAGSCIHVRTLMSRSAGEGRAYVVRGVSIDITQQKKLEAELRQAQKLESVGQLAAGVAHDFNNLLTVIQGNAEMLGEQLAAQPRQQKLAAQIGHAAERSAELTQRLLAFARKQALEPRPVDLNRLLAGMEALMRRTLGEHIQISLACGAGLWTTLVDPGQLENAVLNLAINARDAMPLGGQLNIATSNVHLDNGQAAQFGQVPPGHYVRLVVSDTGVGISAEHQSHVFEPFFTTKEQGKGTGLGLAMVYGFVKQSCGHIVLESEPGCGTRLCLYLPQLLEVPPQALPVQPGPSARGQGQRVLLVEDDAMVRSYSHAQLLELGYRVVEAADGPAALALLRQRGNIDLLLTDVVMPGGMTGRDLADAARRLYPELPVLYTSGYPADALVHDGKLDPGLLLLSKPYRRHELASKLRQALGDPGAPVASGAMTSNQS